MNALTFCAHDADCRQREFASAITASQIVFGCMAYSANDVQRDYSIWRTTLMNNQIRNRNRRGTATVELALVLPIFFAVLLGIIEFGRAMMVSQLVTNAAREGARMAILDGSSNAECEQWIKGFLQSAINAGSADVSVTITVTPAPGNPSPGNEVANASPRDLCTVQVSVPFDRVNYIPGDYLAGKQLTGQSAMRHE